MKNWYCQKKSTFLKMRGSLTEKLKTTNYFFSENCVFLLGNLSCFITYFKSEYNLLKLYAVYEMSKTKR